MDAARWREIEEIFQSAVSRPPETRAAFLREACAGDMDLELRVQSHLAAGDEAGEFLEPPAIEDATTALPQCEARLCRPPTIFRAAERRLVCF